MKHTSLLFVLFLTCYGCSTRGVPVHFIVPDGFVGEIRLVLDPIGGGDVAAKDGKYTYRIPTDGVLRVASFAPFKPWHAQTASYENGQKIPQEHETWVGPNGEKPNLGMDAIVFQGGGVSQLNDEPQVMTFFVGTPR